MKPDYKDKRLTSEQYTWRIVGTLVLMIVVIALQEEMEAAILSVLRTWFPANTG